MSRDQRLHAFADAAKTIRRDHGWSQAEVAAEYGFTQAYVSALESGHYGEERLRDYISFLSQLPARLGRRAGVHGRVGKKLRRIMISTSRLQVITDHAELKKIQNTIRRSFIDEGAQKISISLGTKADTWDMEGYYLAKLGLWSVFGKQTLWNTYGLGDPGVTRDMVCHLTVPTSGEIDRRIGAAYARDQETGAVRILHRGKIGGGREGIGKTAFFEHFHEYGGRFVEAEDGDLMTEFAYVADIESPAVLSDIKTFVVTVKGIKDRAVLE